MLINSIFLELKSIKPTRKFLVFGGIGFHLSLRELIWDYLERLPLVFIVLTTRSRAVADQYYKRIEFKELPE